MVAAALVEAEAVAEGKIPEEPPPAIVIDSPFPVALRADTHILLRECDATKILNNESLKFTWFYSIHSNVVFCR